MLGGAGAVLQIKHRHSAFERTTEQASESRLRSKRVYCKFKYNYRIQIVAIICTQRFADRIYSLVFVDYVFSSFFFVDPSFLAIV